MSFPPLKRQLATNIVRTGTAAGAATVIVSLTVLAGWVFDAPMLRAVFTHLPPMAKPTAAGLALGGLSLLFLPAAGPMAPRYRAVGRARVSAVLALAMGLLAVGRLIAHLINGDASWAASTIPATSMNLAVVAVMLAIAGRDRWFATFQSLALFATLVGWLGLSGYIYGGASLLPRANMALPTALCFVLLCAGALCKRADRGLVSILCSDSLGGTVLRRLLIPALVMPFGLGWLRLRAQQAGWFGLEAGLSLFALSNVVVFVALVWATGLALQRIETSRALAEQALRASEKRTQLIINTALDAVITMDHDGLITGWNPQAEAVFGWSATEAVGRRLAETIIPQNLRGAPWQDLLRHDGSEDTPVSGKRIESTALRRDGRELPVEISVTPMKIAGRISFSVFIRDITDRKRTAEALAASERQYRLIFEESPVPKWIYDTASLRFLAVNRAAVRQYGYSEDEFLGMTIRDIRPPEDIPALEADVAVSRGATTRSSEWKHRRKDGTIIEVIVSAHEVKFGQHASRMVAAVDITEQKQAAAKVQAQLARLDLLHRITRAIGERQDLHSIFQVVVRSLEDNLAIDFCSVCLYDAADQVLTVRRIGVRGMLLATELELAENTRIPIGQNGLRRCVQGELVYEPDLSEVRMPFPERLAAVGLRSVVFAPLLVESQVFGVLLAARTAPRSFSSGECEFLRQLSEHVALAANQAQLYTALQNAYDDLRQTQQAVLQQERLRALGQMASGIAHDINNAISPAALYAEAMLERETGLSERGREQLTIIEGALEDVAQTVGRMREFYRQREPQLLLAPVDANQVAKQVIDLTRVRWSDMPQQRGAMITLAMDLAPALPAFMGVESEIREALINLVFNSVDAMPDGGTLTFRTRLGTGADASSGSFVEIEVGDTGVGMDEETRRRCMEPFFTTKGERGTGLGLAMVYGMVQRHSAEVSIESAVGRGTVIRLRFAAPPEPAAATADREAPTRPRLRLRLLVIDDDPLLIKSLRDILEGDGHLVVSATDGQAGIALFKAAVERQQSFAAVITDLGMPHIDGRKVAMEIKTLSPATPIIMLTGWGERLVSEGDVPPHVDRVLAKPPKLREIREAIARLCLPSHS